MRRSPITRYFALFGTVLLSSAAGLGLPRATAQSLAACDPPRSDEYLLLVLNQQPNTPEQLRQLLPANAVITPCTYLEEEVVRVGGFATADIANAWAQYLADMTGLQAFVARPPGAEDSSATAAAPSGTNTSGTGSFPSPTPSPASGGTSSPTTTQTSSGFPSPTQVAPANSPTSPAEATTTPSTTPPASTGYNPQPLGAGYAVLVQYFNRPEVAADVRQVTTQPVGLVSYEQRPFLLAAHTADASAAATILQSLSDRGFTAVIVDSRRAILLTPAVAGTQNSQS